MEVRLHTHLPRLIVSMLLLIVPLAGCDKHAAEKEAIRDAYNRYAAAVAARDGDTAAKLVSADSLREVERTTRLALGASPSAVKAMNVTDRFEVFLARHLAAGDQGVIKQLGTLKGAELFAYQVKQGWGLDDPTVNVHLGSIRVTRTGAETDIISDGEKDPVPIYFTIEDGKWVRDLTQHQRFDREFASFARKNKISENDLIMLVIEEWTGRYPDEEEMWKAPSPSASSFNGNPLLDN